MRRGRCERLLRGAGQARAAILLCLFVPLLPAGIHAQDVPPILVTGMVHLDPLPTDVADTAVILNAYAAHRAAFQWYVEYARQTGLKLSAQVTGVYAEACVRRNHTGDFASFMPGGTHHLGTHTHTTVKGAGAYSWHLFPSRFNNDPDSVALMMRDNLPWINEIFRRNGFSTADNWFFHGSQGTFPGMDTILFRYPVPNPFPYDNTYRMTGATRGAFYLYRGGFLTEPSAGGDTDYVKMPEVGGIIGFDQVHGPEGMVYGSVPYQKRDFLRVYVEWREAARRNDRSAVRYFSWMVHPYQLLPQTRGTDGRSPRTHIRELVEWLNANFIERRDESGLPVARYANAAELFAAYQHWSGAFPTAARALQDTIAAGSRLLYLPAIYARLEGAWYDDRVPAADSNLIIHRLVDRQSGRALLLVWSRSGRRPVEPALTGAFRILRGDGSVRIAPSSAISAEPEPVLLEQEEPAEVDRAIESPSLSLERNYPNPFSTIAVIRYVLPKAGIVHLRIYDIRGGLVSELASGEQPAGMHAVPFGGGSLPSGVYLIRLEAEGSILTRSMTLMR